MALKVLEENISRSIDCTIEFNGAAGFEMKEGLCQHKVDITRRTCSYRVWQLRGIPCAHVVAVLYFKKFSLYDYIDSCYSKETYLRIYANGIEPLTNMEMWPVSTNPTIEPPEITNMPGRPPKARRKEVGETKKSEKLSKIGLAMTCSICHVRGHNKRGCPQREGVEPSTRQSAPSPTASVRAEPIGSGRGRSKPKIIFELVLLFLNL
uniref:SWIM-type domain-containing protein n=1 Tax=Solanum tuberosum TaxID=4113 RepID=M0ZKY8_SOLTU